MSRLFSPLTLRELQLRHRIVVAPMWQYAGVNGYPTDWHLMHLGRFAEGGAALVFQESTAVERRGCGTTGDLGLWDDSFIEPLSRVASIIRASGARPGIQLGHAGRKARMRMPWEGRGPLDPTAGVADWDAWEPIAPSAVPLREGVAPPREMTTGDIHDVVEAFATATTRAASAGYEVLEVHAGHGYLLHQFLSPATNRRGDAYGGSDAGRMRLTLEVVEAVRAAWPAHLPLFVRMSVVDGAGWGLADSLRLARALKGLGVDVVDCSSGGLAGSPLRPGESLTPGYQVPLASSIRAEADLRTMAVGLIVSPHQADQVVTDGRADLVAIAREALQDPSWPLKAALRLGEPDPYALLSQRSAFWLRQRAAAVPDLHDCRTVDQDEADLAPAGDPAP